MAIKVKITKLNENSFLFDKVGEHITPEAQPKIYRLIRDNDRDIKTTVSAKNVHTNEILFAGVGMDELEVDGVIHTSYEDLSSALTPILFSKGGGSGSGGAIDASNFGKVDKVMNVAPDGNKNVDISSVNFNWTGQHRYSNISDKKADLTYNRIGGFDNSGNMAVVGFQAMKDTFAGFTQAQALEIGQIINGGSGSAGAMSVNLISPPIVQKIDSDEYILLSGANLNLNATAKKIEIINATTKAVVATIPDNQIQLNADGLYLIFYYNFKNLAFGNYLIRLTSGAKVYETTLELKCVQNVNNINIDNVTWDIMYDSDVTPNPSTSAQGRNTTVVIPDINSTTPKVVLKSSELFAQGQDFYIEYFVDLGVFSRNPLFNSSNNTVGFGYSSTPIALAHNALINLTFRGGYNTSMKAYLNGTVGINGGSEFIPPARFTIKIIKIGNLFRILGPGGISIVETLSNNSGYSMFIAFVGRSAPQTIQTQIIKAYTFN